MTNVILGAVGLAVLQGVLSRNAATANVGGFIAGAGRAVRWFTSPAVPAFQNASSTTSATSLAVETAAAVSTAPPTAAAASLPAAVPIPSTAGTPFVQSPQTQAQGGVV